MSREILFRGKLKTDNAINKKGDWVYGNYVTLMDGKHEIPCIYGKGEVISKTVGRFLKGILFTLYINPVTQVFLTKISESV